MMKHLNVKYIIGLSILLAAATSCKDSSTSEDNESENQIINVHSKQDKIRIKIQYAEGSSNEKMKEEWAYNDEKRDTSYLQWEDGFLVEKHHNFSYTKEDGKYIKKYTRSLYMPGYTTAYMTQYITKTYLDSTYNKIKQEIYIGKSDSTRLEYEYNEAGLEIGKTKYKNGKKETEQSDYVYADKSCTYKEGFYNLNKWEIRKHTIEYADASYSLAAKSIIYKSNSADEYERTEYSYSSIGRKILECYYYEESLEYKLRDFQYTDNGVTYYKEDIYNEETNKVKEIFLQ